MVVSVFPFFTVPNVSNDNELAHILRVLQVVKSPSVVHERARAEHRLMRGMLEQREKSARSA